MRDISDKYLVISFTASHQTYADSILDILDPNKELIKYRLYRHHCIKRAIINEEDQDENNSNPSEYAYVKDLRIIKNVDLKDMILIDNSVLSFAFQIDNGITILPFYDNKDDNELIFLKNYLNKISGAKDLLTVNIETIKLGIMYRPFKQKYQKIEEENDMKICLYSEKEKTSSEDLCYKIPLFKSSNISLNSFILPENNNNNQDMSGFNIDLIDINEEENSNESIVKNEFDINKNKKNNNNNLNTTSSPIINLRYMPNSLNSSIIQDNNNNDIVSNLNRQNHRKNSMDSIKLNDEQSFSESPVKREYNIKIKEDSQIIDLKLAQNNIDSSPLTNVNNNIRKGKNRRWVFQKQLFTSMEDIKLNFK